MSATNTGPDIHTGPDILVLEGVENHDVLADDGFGGDVELGVLANRTFDPGDIGQPLNQRHRFSAPVVALFPSSPADGRGTDAHAKNVAWWLRRYADRIEKGGIPPTNQAIFRP